MGATCAPSRVTGSPGQTQIVEPGETWAATIPRKVDAAWSRPAARLTVCLCAGHREGESGIPPCSTFLACKHAPRTHTWLSVPTLGWCSLSHSVLLKRHCLSNAFRTYLSPHGRRGRYLPPLHSHLLLRGRGAHPNPLLYRSEKLRI